MNITEDKLIRNLERIKNKLEKNNLLSELDELTIGILQGILEDMKEEGKEDEKFIWRRSK